MKRVSLMLMVVVALGAGSALAQTPSGAPEAGPTVASGTAAPSAPQSETRERGFLPWLRRLFDEPADESAEGAAPAPDGTWFGMGYESRVGSSTAAGGSGSGSAGGSGGSGGGSGGGAGSGGGGSGRGGNGRGGR